MTHSPTLAETYRTRGVTCCTCCGAGCECYPAGQSAPRTPGFTHDDACRIGCQVRGCTHPVDQPDLTYLDRAEEPTL